MTTMNKLSFLLLIFVLFSCKEKQKEFSSINPVNWEKRAATIQHRDSLLHGMSYLSVYPEIYSYNEHRTHALTSTISMRNTSLKDSIYILSANYYSTNGSLIRKYFSHPIYILPLETVEIVIDELDNNAGSGANFIFEWATPEKSHQPYFEAVMISTSGQQGLSFSTKGIRIE